MLHLLKKTVKFAKEVAIVVKNKVVNFFVGCYRHAEAITVTVLAGIGLTALLGELPFMMLLPLWVEGPFVIPVFSVLVIYLLLKSAEWRSNRRNPLNYLMA